MRLAMVILAALGASSGCYRGGVASAGDPRESGVERVESRADSGGAVSGAIVRAIAEVMAALDSGLAHRDTAALAALVADPFIFVHALDGGVDGRAVWLARAARGEALQRQRGEQTEFGVVLSAYENGSVVRTSRVRLRIGAPGQERWYRQTRVFVRGPDGRWRFAAGQGTWMYEGPIVEAAAYRPYAGRYVIAPGRSIVLVPDSGGMLVRWTNGVELQAFLLSPTEFALGPDRLRFTLGPDGRPREVAAVVDGREIWRAARETAP